MSVLTPFFNLFKLIKGDSYDIQQFNDNMDVIDTEMHRPPLTVNSHEPNEERDIQIDTVPLADNLTSDEAQINTGTFIERTSGGEASIADGSAWLSDIKGNMVKTGYVAESIQMTVTLADPTTESPISASLDRDTFVEEVTSSQTITLTYSNAWSANPATYGITVTGTPVAGDQIVVVYVKENRGTITVANPTSFMSTGWNLYNHAAGYARVVKYSDEYGFMIAGTYTALKFSTTLDGEQTTITPVDGYFTIPSDGFVVVTGGNSTDTEIWMTWSDWTEEANSGVFEAYTSSSIDLTGVMTDFPYGLMRIGNVADEINLNVGKAYSRIQRLEYTDENLASVIASGVPYDTDTDYIYAVRVEPVSYTISLDGQYEVSDHGIEVFVGTSIALTASALYGNDLKGKLRRDVLTISQQTLTSGQQSQVRTNIGAFSQADGNKLNGKFQTEIVAYTDLNSLTTPGFYYTTSVAVTDTLSHCPDTGYNFTMFVMTKGSPNLTQVIFWKGETIYTRSTTGGTFSDWCKFENVKKMTSLGLSGNQSTESLKSVNHTCIDQVYLQDSTYGNGWCNVFAHVSGNIKTIEIVGSIGIIHMHTDNGTTWTITREPTQQSETALFQGAPIAVTSSWSYSGKSFTLTRTSAIRIYQNYNQTSPNGCMIATSSTTTTNTIYYQTESGAFLNAICPPGTYYIWLRGGGTGNNNTSAWKIEL